ncbi:Nif11-like leader peptide family natural product precursor [Puniceicoccus vermicola]|uniref:Nif11 family protein n=1 Tax=Puniceicoccus vermicola TaxID=388746 RepID=A0A7X1E3F4_9BACT|nr:Nif11-like leader peptide family natural product precursor [Puniceicoccus vermicola]MBC2601430.1 Nif11 family protein [Puniceicoccus vermicola]
MSKENVEKLLFAGGADKQVRYRYNAIETKEKFVETAAEDGYEFTVEELEAVLKEEDFDFESSGNPRTRQIWLR